MTDQKLFWAENLRFLRERKKQSQTELAENLNMTRAKLNSHENGLSKNPPLEDLVKIADYFHIAVDTLLKINLSKIGELKLRELEAGNDVYMTGSKVRVLAITVDEKNKENSEYVPVQAKAGYRKGYADPDFIAGLPRFFLPNLPQNRTYRMFPIVGDSMLPIPSGSDILTSYIADWKQIKKDTPCIVVLKNEQDFVFKKVTVQADNSFLLTSLNSLHQPYTVPALDVAEVWRFEKYMTGEFPEPISDLQQLTNVVMELQKEVRSLKAH